MAEIPPPVHLWIRPVLALWGVFFLCGEVLLFSTVEIDLSQHMETLVTGVCCQLEERPRVLFRQIQQR